MVRSRVSSHNRHGPKSGRGYCAPYHEGELGPNLTQCHLGQGLSPWHPDPYSCLATTDIGLKGGPAVSLLRGSWVPSNTMWPGPKPTSVTSGILIHPTIWSQYTNVTDRQTGQDRTGQTTVREHRANRFTNCRPKTERLKRNSPVMKSVGSILRPEEHIW